MFIKLEININVETDTNLFDELLNASSFNDIGKGRKGAVLVHYVDELVPIVRTTSVYTQPAQRFNQLHYYIMDEIKQAYGDVNINFNNAMAEIYDAQYRKMRYHTDQSLDLQDGSYICLFSCYENDSDDPKDMRKLKIKNKITNECSEILLENNSVVLFSTSTNREHLHKIVLESTESNNRWLGLTFRLSNTFIKFVDDIPYFYPTDDILRIASDEERMEFMMGKGKENSSIDYVYPTIDYTVSESDLMPIK